jgi:hypothetical protein
MTDLYQVLREKEMKIDRLRKEIEALHFVIPMLVEDTQPVSAPQSGRNGNGNAQRWP